MQKVSGGGAPDPPPINRILLSSFNGPPASPPMSLALRTFQTFLPKPILTPVRCGVIEGFSFIDYLINTVQLSVPLTEITEKHIGQVKITDKCLFCFKVLLL